MSYIIKQIEKDFMRTTAFPEFKAGDTIKVNVRVKEADKERIQVFQGVVIQRKGDGVSASFTVRKMSSGYGVERIFPLHSPWIDSIELVRRGRVRRARLYYLRDLRGKAARIKELQIFDTTDTRTQAAA